MTRPTVARALSAVARRLLPARERGGVPRDAQARAGEPPAPPPREELERLVRTHGPWYQRIYLGRGVHTLDWSHAAYHESVWAALAPVLAGRLAGASVIDVGSNAGFFALQASRLGARRVLGLEPDARYLAQAELCRRVWDLDVEYRQLGAEQVDTVAEEFDVVLFTGILYHLKNPLRALEQAARRCRDAIVVETEVIPPSRRNRLYVRLGAPDRLRIQRSRGGFAQFLEADELNGDPSNWWVPDTACVLGMLRVAGFRCFSRPCYPESTRLLVVATKEESSCLDRRALG
jgi:tRNA (mo5U34)-methyltransferase